MNKKIINNYKIFIGILIGIMLSGATVMAFALNSKDVLYDNASSGINSTNVQDAIDELYNTATIKINEAKNKCPDGYICEKPNTYTHYEFGNPTEVSTTNYKDIMNSNNTNIFIQLASGQLSVCIYINDALECFKNNNYENEISHLNKVFGDSNCSYVNSYYRCTISNFACNLFDYGSIHCGAYSRFCNLNNDSSIYCG